MKMRREKRMIQTMLDSLSELLALSNFNCVRLKAVLGDIPVCCLSSGIMLSLVSLLVWPGLKGYNNRCCMRES